MTGRCVSCGSPFDLASYDGTGRCQKCREGTASNGEPVTVLAGQSAQQDGHDAFPSVCCYDGPDRPPRYLEIKNWYPPVLNEKVHPDSSSRDRNAVIVVRHYEGKFVASGRLPNVGDEVVIKCILEHGQPRKTVRAVTTATDTVTGGVWWKSNGKIKWDDPTGLSIPNHGPCAYCGQDVDHVYPWWTANPEKPGARPLHEECRAGYEGQETAVAVRHPRSASGGQPGPCHMLASVQVESSVGHRRKILRINTHDILLAVYGMKTAGQLVEGCTCLPEGFRVLSIHEQWRTVPQCIEMVVEHPSFDEVPENQLLPVLHCGCRLNVVPLPDTRGKP